MKNIGAKIKSHRKGLVQPQAHYGQSKIRLGIIFNRMSREKIFLTKPTDDKGYVVVLLDEV